MIKLILEPGNIHLEYDEDLYLNDVEVLSMIYVKVAQTLSSYNRHNTRYSFSEVDNDDNDLINKAASVARKLNRRYGKSSCKDFIARENIIFHYCEESDTYKRLDTIKPSDCESCKAARLMMNRLLSKP